MGNIVDGVDFSQTQFIEYFTSDENRGIYSTVFNEYGLDLSKLPGYCYGFSSSFLTYAAEGNGEKFLRMLNHLNYVLTNDEGKSVHLSKIKQDALKIHAKEILDYYMLDVITTQNFNEKGMLYSDYVENLLGVDLVTKKRNFIEYVEEVFEYNHLLALNKNIENSDYYDYLNNGIKIKTKKYWEALHAEPSFFETNDGKAVVSDPLFIKLKNKFKSKLKTINENYSHSDITFFVDVIITDVQRDLYLELESYNRKRGIANSRQNISNYGNQGLYEIKLSELSSSLMEHTRNSKEPFLCHFSSEQHSMAISVNYDDENKNWKYRFFDPNAGTYMADEHQVFVDFIEHFISMNKENYNFSSFENGEHKVYISIVGNSATQSDRGKFKGIEAKRLRDLEIKLLIERKEIIEDNELSIKLIYTGYNEQKNIVEAQVTVNGKIITIFSDVMEFTDFFDKLKSSKDLLKTIEGDIFISKNEYKVYRVNHRFNINEDKKIEQYIDNNKVIAKLDTDFFDTHINHMKEDRLLTLAGEQSASTEKIDSWLDPYEIYQAERAKDADPDRARKPTEYSYNVIVQIEGDEISSKATAHAFSKHPDNSMIIQYDIKSRQYKIIHGEINRLNLDRVRWITVGHGGYIGGGKPTLYGKNTPEQFAEGMSYLRKKILNSQSPDKLVLIGCNLGRGGVSENFAFGVTGALAEKGMKMPIIAYNRKVSVIYMGNKLIVPDDTVLDSITTKHFKQTYQFDPKILEININNKLGAVYFIDELRRGEIDFKQLIDNENHFMFEGLGMIPGIDSFASFRDGDSYNIDFNLLRKVAYNPEGYKQFIDEVAKHKGELPDDFHAYFSNKLRKLDTPIWEMVDADYIKNNPLRNRGQDGSFITVVIRLTGESKGLDMAQRLARSEPDNVMIIQADPNLEQWDMKQWNLEYGSVSNLQSKEKPVRWVLIGDSDTVIKTNKNLHSLLANIRDEYPFINPKQILFQGIDTTMVTTAGDHKQFTNDLSTKLKEFGFDSQVISKLTFQPVSKPISQPVATNHMQPTLTANNNHEYLSTLLENIALENTVIKDINITDHPYLANYFTDSNGQLDIKKLKIAIYDPLVSPKVNEYLNQAKNEDLTQWNSLFKSKPLGSLQEQAGNINRILVSIQNDLSYINKLSEDSIEQLRVLFPAINGFDKGKVLALSTDRNAFMLLSLDLKNFSQLNPYNFDSEDAPLKGLLLDKALSLYQENNRQRQQQFNQLINNTKNNSNGSEVNLINHGMIRQHGYSENLDKKLGLTYGLESLLGDIDSARILMKRKAYLEQQQHEGLLSNSEEVLLKKLEQYSSHIDRGLSDTGILVEDLHLSNILTTELSDVELHKGAIYLLKGESTTYTVTYKLQDGIYQYSLFDPNGIQIQVKQQNKRQAKSDFRKVLTSYLNEEISIENGKWVSRAKHAGFIVDSNGEPRGTIVFIDPLSTDLKERMSLYSQQRNDIINHTDFNEPKNSWINIKGEDISLAKLQKLGTTIDGKAITVEETRSEGWSNKIRFNAQSLAAELTLLSGSDSDLAFLKALSLQLNDTDIADIVEYDADFRDTAILKKQLKYLAKFKDANGIKFTPKHIEKLRGYGVKLPPFQKFGNRLGQVMGGVGIGQTLVSIYSIIDRLNNPDITEDEYDELKKQLYITCGSALANYGDMIVQPVLLKMAGNSSSLVRSRLAMGVLIVFNLVGMGFDAYQAYDNLSKLESVSDPKQREDLIVNASLSIASFIVNGIVIISILAASSTIPVAGLVIGAILMIGGWIYNGIRAVENIKEQIDISWDRELEEGIRGAFGLPPTIRTQQEIMNKNYIALFMHNEWLESLNTFEQLFEDLGFSHHLKVMEKPIIENEERFYLVDEDNNYFGGPLADVHLGHGFSEIKYLKRGAPTYSWREADILQRNYHLQPNGHTRAKRPYEAASRKYVKQLSEVKGLKQVGSVPTSERYSFNVDYNNPLLDRYNAKHGIERHYYQIPFEQQFKLSAQKQINLYITKGGYSHFKESITQVSDDAPNGMTIEGGNIDEITLSLNNIFSKGMSIDTATGDDVVIGKKNKMNAFQISTGEKYLVGGNKTDYFYLNDSDINSLKSGGNEQTKYLDGLLGQDTLMMSEPIFGYSVHVNLNECRVSYQNDKTGDAINVANIENIENIILFNKSNDEVHGDEQQNIIDVGAGKDKAYGYGGNDRLILVEGEAHGGDGDDSYYIRRFDWTEHAPYFYRTRTKYNRKNKNFVDVPYINPEYFKINEHKKVFVSINEDSQSVSSIDIEYTLDEISAVYIENNHLYIKLSLEPENKLGHTFTNVKSEVTIELRNAYSTTADGRKLQHSYNITTRDGFTFNSELKTFSNEEDKSIKKDLFSITYLQDNDQLSHSRNDNVYINEQSKEITIRGVTKPLSPSWGHFYAAGKAKNFQYQGTDENNQVQGISEGAFITVSLGQDVYQIIPTLYKNGEVIFDFSEVKDRYSKEDKIVLLLPTENAYSFTLDGKILRVKDKLNEEKFSIRFENFDESMSDSVIIQDKYSNIFKLKLQQEGGTIDNIEQVTKRIDDNYIVTLPAGYLSNEPVIAGEDGDDIITDRSMMGRIILGGRGDDTIKVFGGNNVLLGGEGENSLSGGEGHDFLLSSQGNDILMGGKGNDHYLIDGSYEGMVFIDDTEGYNHIHLVNFSGETQEEADENGNVYRRYRSDFDKYVIVKFKSEERNTPQIHIYPQLTPKLQKLMEYNSESLIGELTKELSNTNKTGQLSTWNPVEKLHGILEGIQKPISLTPRSEYLFLDSTNSKGNWLVNTLEGDDTVNDKSGDGRIIMGDGGFKRFSADGGNNVLYGGKGESSLVAGSGDDVLISLSGDDVLNGMEGDDLYVVNGYGEGHVAIYATQGENKVILVGFDGGKLIEDKRSNGIVESTLTSNTGRVVTIYYRNHEYSDSDSVSVEFYKDNKDLWKNHSELVVDRLLQVLASSREKYENNLDMALPVHEQSNWAPTTYVESYLAKTF